MELALVSYCRGSLRSAASDCGFRQGPVNARSVTTQVFDQANGGAEHCQNGNMTLVHAAGFSRVRDTFAAA